MYVDGRKRNSRQKWNNDSQFDCKKSTTHRACEETYACNYSTCACEYDKDCQIDE